MSLSRTNYSTAKFTSVSNILAGRSGASWSLIPTGTRLPFDISDRKPSRYLTLASNPGATHMDVAEDPAQVVKIREQMENFLIYIIVNLCLYALVVLFRTNLVYDLDTSILMSACLLLLLLVTSVPVVLKRGLGCLQFYGLNRPEWSTKVRSALTHSLPILALIVLAKWIAIRVVPNFDHLNLFSGRLSQCPWQSNYLVQLAIYVVLIPVQEFVARGILQGSLQEFLTGRSRILKAILISNLLFSTFHLFVSLYFALLSFLPGMFWGWLYSRQRSLVAVSASHTLIGVWALYLVGTPGLIIGA